MKNNLVSFTKQIAIVLLLGIFFFSIPSAINAQISLRNAMDRDGDGKADLTVWRPSNNVWYSLNGGNLPFLRFGLSSVDYPTPGDYDGDGKGDLAIWRETDGVWWWLRSSDSTVYAVQFGATGDEPIARDYDGDGITDPAIVRRFQGALWWYVYRSTDQGYYAFPFGLSTDFVIPGDFNGDGKFDFVVQRSGATPQESSVFHTLLNVTFTYSAVAFGLGTDLVVPGDYDGDGTTDLAVVRETNGVFTWYALQSSDGNLFTVNHGGDSSDFIVQNDYDGDGTTDPAVWNDTTGDYSILYSSNNSVFVRHWGVSGDIPVAAYDTH